MLNRRVFLSGAITLLAASALADTEFYSKDGVAIEGYDPVAYFTVGKAVRGDASISSTHSGATFYFSTVENKSTFDAAPEKYAPQFGGHCAWAASQNYIAKSDPEAWTVHNGKLYLNYNKSIRRKWLKNIDDNIAKGDANWLTLKAEIK